MRMMIDTTTADGYRQFLRVRQLPVYNFHGDVVEFPDEYAESVGALAVRRGDVEYVPSDFLMDYQAAITGMAVKKRKFCIFADCGLGKTLMFLDWARHVLTQIRPGQCILIVSPIMVVGQTIAEAERFYGDTLPIERVPSGHLAQWLRDGTSRIGITNYEAFTKHISRGRLGALIVDESSMLKSHYGKWGTEIVKLGRGLDWKLAGTGTPAPNDRIEYANHGVLMDVFPTVNSFLARYFINRGQTDNRWEIKAHAVKAFYRDMSHWCIFLTNPKTYGWKDNTEHLPPINVTIHDVNLTDEQRRIVSNKTGELFVTSAGGIMNRTRLAGLAKGYDGTRRIVSLKPKFIRELVESWPDESTIIWCLYNREQRIIEEELPDAASIDGDTPLAEREKIIADFKARRVRVLITKPKILGFGLNLQVATRQVFSGLQDSYENYYQAVKRSNRYGSTRPLNVHIPITEIERPMIDTVLSKAKRVQQDAEQIERRFVNAAI